MRRFFLVSAALGTSLLVSCLAASVSAQAQAPRRLAVLVGVEDYSHERLRSPKLKYPIEDVTEFGAILKEHDYEVILLTDDEGAKDPQKLPNKENIERNCASMLKNAKRSDTIVLAFAGHGLQFSGDRDAYFCPIDAQTLRGQKGFTGLALENLWRTRLQLRRRQAHSRGCLSQ